MYCKNRFHYGEIFMALTNEQLLEKFEQDMKYSLEGLAESTIRGNITYVKKFLETLNKPAFDITKNEISGYVMNLKKQNGNDPMMDKKLFTCPAENRVSDHLSCHYGINTRLCGHDAGQRKSSQITQPTQAILNLDNSRLKPDNSSGDPGIDYAIAARISFRHNSEANVLYFDGHSDSRKQTYLVSKADGTKDAGNRGRLDIGFSGDPF